MRLYHGSSVFIDKIDIVSHKCHISYKSTKLSLSGQDRLKNFSQKTSMENRMALTFATIRIVLIYFDIDKDSELLCNSQRAGIIPKNTAFK